MDGPALLDARGRVERLLVITACAGVWVGSLLYAPLVHAGPTLCPLRLATGLPCPGCGLTRAFCAVVQGRLHEAIGWNALWVPLALLFVAAPLQAGLELAWGSPGRWYRGLLFSSRVARWVGAVVAVYHVERCLLWLADGTLVTDFGASLLGRAWRLVIG